MRKLLVLLVALGAMFAFTPATAHAAICGPTVASDAQCPPMSEWHAIYGASNTFLNIGNAESRSLSTLAAAVGPNWPHWTGTTYSYRVTNIHVVASIYVFNENTRYACRGSYDVYGSNSYSQGVYGGLNYCWNY